MQNMKHLRPTGAVAFLLASIAALPAAAQTEPVQAEAAKIDRFSGGTFRIIVPHAPGGGLDGYARMIAPYLTKHSGATVAIENMPGAGGIVGNNEMWSSEPDGFTLSFTSLASMVLADLSGNEGAQSEAAEATWIGRSSAQPRLFLSGVPSGIETAEDLRELDRAFVYPAVGADEDFYAMNIFAEALGMELSIVSGYESAGDSNLSVFAGDTDGVIIAATQSAPIVAGGDLIPLLSFTSERHPAYPDLPTPAELVGAENATLDAIVSVLEMDRGFIGPPGMDEPTTEALRELMAEVHADPELVAQAEEAKLPIIFLHGDEVQAKVDEVVAASGTLVPALEAAVARLQ